MTLQGVAHSIVDTIQDMVGEHGIIAELLELEKQLSGKLEEVRVKAGAKLQTLIKSRPFQVLLSSLPPEKRERIMIYVQTLKDLLGVEDKTALYSGHSTRLLSDYRGELWRDEEG